MQPKKSAARTDVESALASFNQLSNELIDSYSALENQVAHLSQSLATEQQQKEEALLSRLQVAEQLEGLLTLLPAGVLVLNSQGVIERSNPAAEELLQLSLTGRRWTDVIERCLQSCQIDGHEIATQQGRFIQIDTRSLKDGVGQLILLTDLTETRQLQERLSQTKRLSAMGEMTAALAHQIRTPVSAALLYASHLCHNNLGIEKKTRFANKLLTQLRHLEHLVGDMLLFAKGDTLQVMQVPVEELLQQITEKNRAYFDHSKQRLLILDQSEGAAILCSTDAFLSAIQNIVDNAIEASSDEGQIALIVQRSSQHVQFIIADNGSGMAPEVQQRLFEPFFTTRVQGTGLGLAVTKAVIEAHRGAIEVHSELQQGTRFLIQVPLANVHSVEKNRVSQ
ncbi:MAG TPA: PAS domain-containing sensor histidine kinase [Gammaproteobacteria bacterium]|nr:PAS domain-containing sensor histidine kinase [Gammaproteobacteria bacterium]